ncbi:MAG: GNAT family N-acetyltransferase [Candidatus Cryosericum sp.]
MILGERISIRPLELGDEEYLYRWWNDGSVMARAGWFYGKLESKEAIRDTVVAHRGDAESPDTARRFMVCKRGSMEPIGEAGYSNWDAHNQSVSIHFGVYEGDEQQKAYGLDALYHFVDFLFRYLNLNKIELTTMPDDKSAVDMYHRMGFQDIGIIRQAQSDSRVGGFSDLIYMDLLRSEWSAARASAPASF